MKRISYEDFNEMKRYAQIDCLVKDDFDELKPCHCEELEERIKQQDEARCHEVVCLEQELEQLKLWKKNCKCSDFIDENIKLGQEVERLREFKEAVMEEFSCFGTYNQQAIPCSDTCYLKEVCETETILKGGG